MGYETTLGLLAQYATTRRCLPWLELKAGTVEYDAAKVILDMFKTNDFKVEFELNGCCAMLGLDDGSTVGFFLENLSAVEASAMPLSADTHAVSLTTGTILALWQLSLAVWTSPVFLVRPQFGYGRLQQDDVAAAVPRGMDAIFSATETAVGDGVACLTVPWIRDALASLSKDPVRSYLANTSFLESVCWCWLHECAHVRYGHYAWGRTHQLVQYTETLSIANRARGKSLLQPWPEVSQLAEIQADRCATGLLALSAGRRRDPNSYCYSVAAFVGHILVPLVLRGSEIAYNSGEQSSTHPPLWARADLIRTEFNRFISYEAMESLAFQVNDATQQALNDLANLHNYYGLLFQSATRSASESPLSAFEKSLTEAAGESQPLTKSTRLKKFVGLRKSD